MDSSSKDGVSWNLISSALISLILVLYFYCSYKLNYWKRRGVEYLPGAHLIFGNFKKAILFQSAPGWYLGRLYNQANTDSPIIGFYIFHKPCLLLRDPKIIKQILTRDFENFSDRNFAGTEQKDSIGMRNLFGLRNPAWRYVRTKITPTLTRGKLKQMFPLMMETGMPMMDSINQLEWDKGVKVIDVQELNYKYCTDLIANVALGTKVDSFNYPDSEFTKARKLKAGGYKNKNIHNPWFYISWFDIDKGFGRQKAWLGVKFTSRVGANYYDNETPYRNCHEVCRGVTGFFHSFKRMIALASVFFMPEVVNMVGSAVLFDSKFVNKIFWNAVESREKSGEIRGDYIDSIIQLKNGTQNPLYKFEGENLLFQSGTFFSVFESSSTSAAFTLMELARNKIHQDRARKEIQAAIKSRGWTFDAFSEMKFLDQCVLEGVRLHPPVSTIDRCTRSDYKIPDTNIVIERGTAIYISLYGLQEDPKYFEHPEVYDPERFNQDRIVSEAYMPFGIGPRMCVGMKLGQLHAKLVIAMILSKYEIFQTSGDKNELDPRSTFTAAAGGLHLEFTELNKYCELEL